MAPDFPGKEVLHAVLEKNVPDTFRVFKLKRGHPQQIRHVLVAPATIFLHALEGAVGGVVHYGFVRVNEGIADVLFEWTARSRPKVVDVRIAPGLLRYFFLRATTRTRLVCEIAPGVSASFTISACSC